MIRFLILVSNLTFLDFAIFWWYILWHFCQKWVLYNMFPTKCQGQNDRMGRAVISCFCQNLQFWLYFAIKTSIFKLRPLLRFLCLINSFYRRYVCCIHNRSNGSNGSPFFFIISPLFFIISPLFLHYSFTISHYFSLFIHYFTLHWLY